MWLLSRISDLFSGRLLDFSVGEHGPTLLSCPYRTGHADGGRRWSVIFRETSAASLRRRSPCWSTRCATELRGAETFSAVAIVENYAISSRLLFRKQRKARSYRGRAPLPQECGGLAGTGALVGAPPSARLEFAPGGELTASTDDEDRWQKHSTFARSGTTLSISVSRRGCKLVLTAWAERLSPHFSPSS
jgi:hypothetical protein